jgi:hypothetical protein
MSVPLEALTLWPCSHRRNGENRFSTCNVVSRLRHALEVSNTRKSNLRMLVSANIDLGMNIDQPVTSALA